MLPSVVVETDAAAVAAAATAALSLSIALAAGTAGTEAEEENVDLTFERMEGRRPGSGSSANGLGKVVSPETGEGRDELATDADAAVGGPVSMVRWVSRPDIVYGARGGRSGRARREII